MRKCEVPSPPTVYHDGQFCVGVVGRVEDGALRVTRLVFGLELPNEQIHAWVPARWSRLTVLDLVLDERPKASVKVWRGRQALRHYKYIDPVAGLLADP